MITNKNVRYLILYIIIFLYKRINFGLEVMKKLMILGAGILQTYVIKKAKQIGVKTVAVDANPQSVGFRYADNVHIISIIDQEKCLECAKQEGIDGVLTAATDYGVLTASYISENLGLPGIPYEVAKILKNKYMIRKKTSILYEDYPIQFFEVDSIEQVKTLNDRIRYPVMVKPVDGSGSRGAGCSNDFDSLIQHCKKALDSSKSKKVLIETFIAGKEYGVESFVYNGEIHILTIMKKYMTNPPYYAELGHSAPADLPSNVEQRVKAITEKTIRILGIYFGSVNMDLLITENGMPFIVDVGARMGGNLIGSHIVPIATGIDYIGNIIKATICEPVDFTPGVGKPVSTALLALTPGIITWLPDFSVFRKRKNVIEIIFNKQIGDSINFYKNNLDGCGYIVTTGENSIDAHELAFSLRDEIDKSIGRI